VLNYWVVERRTRRGARHWANRRFSRAANTTRSPDHERVPLSRTAARLVGPVRPRAVTMVLSPAADDALGTSGLPRLTLGRVEIRLHFLDDRLDERFLESTLSTDDRGVFRRRYGPRRGVAPAWHSTLDPVPLIDRNRQVVRGGDATFYERSAASHHYCQRISYRVQKLKVTKRVDTATQAVLDLHCSTTREGSDADLAEQIARRNAGDLRSLAADKGYDKQSLRRTLRELGSRPLIKHRIFAPYDHAHNARIDEQRYNQRSMTETVVRNDVPAIARPGSAIIGNGLRTTV